MVTQQERTRLMEAYRYEPTANIPAYVRVAKLLPFLVIVVGLGYATATRVEDSQPVANAGEAVSAGISLDIIGVSSAHAGQHRMEPQGGQYFPDGYVNQAQDRYEHIQAF
jgi:hypothetical protein